MLNGYGVFEAGVGPWLEQGIRSSRARLFIFFVGIVFAAFPHSALSAQVPIWSHFNRENSDLPSDTITQLALSPDGALWVGTNGGLARLDKDGHWQSYEVNTNGGLPDVDVNALVLSPDGTLWVGTAGGLARLDEDGHWQTYTKANT